MPLPARAVFTDWQAHSSLESILSECKSLLEDMTFPTVRAWRAQGGKVLGHFQVYFPEELAFAAGMLPFKIRGAPLEARHADSHFGSYLCSILKTSLELALSDRVLLDMFVSHPICDAARNLAAIWGRNRDYGCQILYLPQNANSTHASSYLHNEYRRLLDEIEQVTGSTIADDDLRTAITVFNENRSLLRRLYAIKRTTPWLLSVDQAYVLTTIGGLIPRPEHNRLLQTVLPLIAAGESKSKDKIRVVFEGGFCEQPPLELLQTIGRYCYVVDDDLMIGLRWLTEDVPTTGDPLSNLAEAYLNASAYSPVQHDARKPKEHMLLARIRDADADAAIITAAKMCEPGLEEQVAYTFALNQQRIPFFVSEFEENMTSFEQLEIQLETFAENIMFD
ncbi:MAG: 2-hydroxyacyl-CoA dehydratase [Chloroflexi bacterium]|nr:2-hydroxyacyl-CoA dehydratase [Chloroflexota bacterium]